MWHRRIGELNVSPLHAMWVRMKTEECTEAKARRKRRELKAAIPVVTFICLLLAAITAAVPGWSEGGLANVRSWDEFLLRFPGYFLLAAAFSLIFGFCAVRWGLPGRSKTFVCPKCQTIKAAGDGNQCSCGGETVNVEEMKWVEDK